MLTKTDLKEIDKVLKKRIREEVEAEGRNIKDELTNKIVNFRLDLSQNTREIGDRIKTLDIRINNIEKITKKGFEKIEMKLDKTSDFLDRDNMQTKNRVERIEKHLQFPTTS